MALCGSKPRITLSKQNIGYIAVNLLVKQHLHVLFGVKPGIGRELSLLKNIPLHPDGLKVFSHSFYHGLQKLVFLWLSKRFRMPHFLMLAIYRRYPIIALDHSMGALHLQVALAGLAALAYLLLVFFKPAL